MVLPEARSLPLWTEPFFELKDVDRLVWPQGAPKSVGIILELKRRRISLFFDGVVIQISTQQLTVSCSVPAAATSSTVPAGPSPTSTPGSGDFHIEAIQDPSGIVAPFFTASHLFIPSLTGGGTWTSASSLPSSSTRRLEWLFNEFEQRVHIGRTPWRMETRYPRYADTDLSRSYESRSLSGIPLRSAPREFLTGRH